MTARKQQHRVKTVDGVTTFVAKTPYKKQLQRLLSLPLGRLLVAVVVVCLTALVTLGLWPLWHATNNKGDLVTQVGKLMVLPANEKPIIATVTDKSALKTPFLQEASNGDRILIYEKAKRVIIYRPSLHKIVDVGPVELANIPAVSQ